MEKEYILIEKTFIDKLRDTAHELIRVGGAFDTHSYVRGQAILDLIKDLETANLHNQNQL